MFSSILSRHLVSIDIAPRWCNVYSWPTVLPCRSRAFSSRPGWNLCGQIGAPYPLSCDS